MTVEEYSERILGSLKFLYYFYLNSFRQRPVDLLDMADGMLYMDLRGYTEEVEMRNLERERAKNGNRT